MKDKTDVKINNIMPCVPTRDLVVFPGMSMHFDVGRPRTIKSMKNAMDGDQLVFLCAQKTFILKCLKKGYVQGGYCSKGKTDREST